MLLHPAFVALVVDVFRCSSGVRGEVHVEVVDDVGQEFELCGACVCVRSNVLVHSPLGSLISCPSGVPTSVNFLPLSSFRSPLIKHI